MPAKIYISMELIFKRKYILRGVTMGHKCSWETCIVYIKTKVSKNITILNKARYIMYYKLLQKLTSRLFYRILVFAWRCGTIHIHSIMYIITVADHYLLREGFWEDFSCPYSFSIMIASTIFGVILCWKCTLRILKKKNYIFLQKAMNLNKRLVIALLRNTASIIQQ